MSKKVEWMNEWNKVLWVHSSLSFMTCTQKLYKLLFYDVNNNSLRLLHTIQEWVVRGQFLKGSLRTNQSSIFLLPFPTKEMETWLTISLLLTWVQCLSTVFQTDNCTRPLLPRHLLPIEKCHPCQSTAILPEPDLFPLPGLLRPHLESEWQPTLVTSLVQTTLGFIPIQSPVTNTGPVRTELLPWSCAEMDWYLMIQTHWERTVHIPSQLTVGPGLIWVSLLRIPFTDSLFWILLRNYFLFYLIHSHEMTSRAMYDRKIL